MADILVNSERLHGTSGRLDQGAQEIQSELSSMESEVRALVDAEWRGAASQSFSELWANWQSSAAQLRESLDGISQLMSQSARAYEETEQGIAGAYRQ